MGKHNKEECIRLIKDGYTANEIAELLNYKISTVYATAKKEGLTCAKRAIIRTCLHCGKEFSVNERFTKVYCSEACQKKASYARMRENKSKRDDSFIPEMLKKNAPEWEYIGGYTGSEGTMIVRHMCGFTTQLSSITVRHSRMKCWLCKQKNSEKEAQRKKEEKKKQEARAREVRRLSRPVPKRRQIGMKQCIVCGAFFCWWQGDMLNDMREAKTQSL